MLRDELEKITLQAMTQTEYNEIVEKMKNAAMLGRDFIYVENISEDIFKKLTTEGIFIRESMMLNAYKYILSWM
ncbi:hypothetical protein [Terrisporobacter sp.]|uniref:hypothetical protein n=1 Tax=Terrisporobacter sp. TaxID=1965305 RepID=UPI0028A07EE0|nr:hypothetical protein [Terrisporobacter sp.]